MPLYTSKRDSGFLLGVNREIMHGFSSVEVGVYKLDLENTSMNIYEESNNRTYKPAVRVFALISFDQKTALSEDTGTDFQRTLAVGFLRADLKQADLFLEEGDIIEYNDGFFQVDVVSTTNYWSGRNPETMIGNVQDGWAEHGYNIAIQCECHLTRLNSLNIIDTRIGETPSPIQTDSSIPKFL